MIQVSDCERVRRQLTVIDRHPSRERAILLPEIHSHAQPFADGDDVQQTVSIEVYRFGHPNCRIGWAEGHSLEIRKRGVAVVEVHIALPAVTMWNGEVDEPILIEVSCRDRCRGFVREGNAGGVE